MKEKRITCRYAYFLLFSLLFIFQAKPLTSQIKRQALSDFVEKKSREWQIKKTLADSLARMMDLPIRGVLDDGTAYELQYFENGRPFYYITLNLDAAKTVSANKVWPDSSLGLELDGNGEVLGIWDGGLVLNSHDEFGSRVINLDDTTMSDHATHVAGTMIASGVDYRAKGMASLATLRAYDFNNDVSEMGAEQLLPNPIKISNHSYGIFTGWHFDTADDGLWVWYGDTQYSEQEDYIFGFYHQKAHDYDQIVFDSPNYLIVIGAGNDRGPTNAGADLGELHWHYNGAIGMFEKTDQDYHPPDGGIANGFDTITGTGQSAKNVLTVGAINSLPSGYSNPNDIVMTSFSSWGPTDDGRIKPDIVADGDMLYSSIATGNHSYSYKSGTSTSAPSVTGSIALLNQHANNLFGKTFKASTNKALVIHTANEAGEFPGPDYKFGWGLLNTARASEIMTSESQIIRPYFHINELELNNGEVIQFEFENFGAEEIRATIAWTDPPGTPPETALDPSDVMLVNDIDLRILGPGYTYMPWTFTDPSMPENPPSKGDNHLDNVEQILIQDPPLGKYNVQISHKGTLYNSEPQIVNLILTDGLNEAFIESWGISGFTEYIPKSGPEVRLTQESNDEKTGFLKINVPPSATFDHDYLNSIDDAPQLRREIGSGDWVVETKLELIKYPIVFPPVKNFHVGIMVYFSQYELYTWGFYGPKQLELEGLGESGTSSVSLNTDKIELRIRKHGNTYFFDRRSVGSPTWIEVNEKTVSLEATAVGLMTKTWGTRPEVEVDFDYFRFALLPQIPILSSPINGATEQPIALTLDWQPSEEAISYQVQVDNSSNFISPVYDGVTSNTSVLVNGLAINTNYYWRIRANGAPGAGGWSEVWGFTTVSPPGTPQLLDPPDGSPGQAISLSLDWQEVGGANDYRVQVSTASTFESLTLDSTTVSSIVLISGLSYNTIYYWRASAIGEGGMSHWSEVWQFVTINTPAVFEIERLSGNVLTSGTFISGGADLAERILVSEPVEPGDIVELDPENPQYYRKARGDSKLIAGVITIAPGFTVGNKHDKSNLDSLNHPMIALVGRVPAKVTIENGAIKPGDALTLSSEPGCAMRASASNSKNTIIGKALEAIERGTGTIMILITTF